MLMLASIAYIQSHRPSTLTLENSSALGAYARHRELFGCLLSELQKYYTARWDIVVTSDHSIAHNRKRLYIIGVLGEPLCELQFPPPSLSRIPLSAILTLDTLPSGVMRRPHPPVGQPGVPALHAENVIHHYNNYIKRGIDVFQVPICIDYHLPPAFASSSLDPSPSLTSSRCASGGYWSSSFGGA